MTNEQFQKLTDDINQNTDCLAEFKPENKTFCIYVSKQFHQFAQDFTKNHRNPLEDRPFYRIEWNYDTPDSYLAWSRTQTVNDDVVSFEDMRYILNRLHDEMTED